MSKGRQHAERRKAQAAAARPHRNRKRYYRPAEGRIEDYVTMADVWYSHGKDGPAYLFIPYLPYHEAMRVATELHVSFGVQTWLEEV